MISSRTAIDKAGVIGAVAIELVNSIELVLIGRHSRIAKAFRRLEIGFFSVSKGKGIFRMLGSCWSRPYSRRSLGPAAVGGPVIVVIKAVLPGHFGCGGSNGSATCDLEERVLFSKYGGVHRVDGSASGIEQITVSDA